jgi:ethanolamine utilization protein EutN
MRLGRIIGKVWATAKIDTLTGIRLHVMQPLDHHRQPEGNPMIAIDAVGAGEGETVFWVGGADASLAIPDRILPSDASIIGIVDQLNTEDGDP